MHLRICLNNFSPFFVTYPLDLPNMYVVSGVRMQSCTSVNMNSCFLLLIYWKFSTGTELILSTLYRYAPNFEEIEGADCFGFVHVCVRPFVLPCVPSKKLGFVISKTDSSSKIADLE